jgi:pimeloyl-ACP methyl ester carboxylesterase
VQPEQTKAAGEGSQLAESNGLLLCYQEFGDPEAETILLVMGLGMQMLAWDEEFCELLAMQGYRVVRFDNRDVGLSSKVSGRVNVTAGMLGLTGSAVYTLDDMAADTVGLLDHLGAERAHLVGASMGAMISQKVAATRPDRVASLCSIMSGTGRRRLSTTPRLDALRLLVRSPATTREDYITAATMMFGVIGSPDYPTDKKLLREHAERAWDRCFYPSGVARQLMAVLASGDRTKEVRRITAPTLVIHGLADKLIPPRAGRDTAAAIEGSRLELVPGMGHDFPRQLWQPISEMIIENAQRGSADADGAEERRGAGTAQS